MNQSFHHTLEHRLDRLLSGPIKDVMAFIKASSVDSICFFIATAKKDWQKGSQLLNLVCLQQSANKNDRDLSAPITAGLLWHFYKTAPSKKEGFQLLEDCFSSIFNYHHHLYTHHDKDDNGLIHQMTLDGQKSMVDPFFQSILAWSNQSLIQIGALLDEDITEAVLWNELSLYSCQEELWDDKNCCFHQLIDGQVSKYEEGSHLTFLSLFGNILIQKDAEDMLAMMQSSGYPVHESNHDFKVADGFNLPATLGYILLLGLQNYDMEEASNRLMSYLRHSLDGKEMTEMEVIVLGLLQHEGAFLHRVSDFD